MWYMYMYTYVSVGWTMFAGLGKSRICTQTSMCGLHTSSPPPSLSLKAHPSNVHVLGHMYVYMYIYMYVHIYVCVSWEQHFTHWRYRVFLQTCMYM